MPTINGLTVEPKSLLVRPSVEQLRELSAQMPTARMTEFDNVNVSTKVLARSKRSTFIVDNDQSKHSDQCISREEFDRVSKLQNEFIADCDMIQVDGYIGSNPAYRTPARLLMEKAYANIAAMQNLLYYPIAEDEKADFKPELTVIYTPSCPVENYPDDRLIAVDLDNNLTRVFNSDYFGESKKGGLRMWNAKVYKDGGLPLHAGLKVIPVEDKQRVMMIVGLSGTGKTTTTFTRQNGSSPVQDDFVAWMGDGQIHSSENGCFAKTFALSEKDEPTIHHAVSLPVAYLENVSQNDDNKIDFFDESYTQNGRAVIRMEDVDGAMDAKDVGKADVLLILNRNENIIPAVCKLNAQQAAAYFMLGETQGTAAGGKEEAGKALRIPGTNPFFPLLHSQQGNRFLELMEKTDLEVYVMNTGRVGGSVAQEGSEKVSITHSSAIVKAIAEGTIEWQEDTDFGTQIAASVPGLEGDMGNVLNPRAMYESQGRVEEYDKLVNTLKAERVEFLKSWPGLDDRIVGVL